MIFYLFNHLARFFGHTRRVKELNSTGIFVLRSKTELYNEENKNGGILQFGCFDQPYSDNNAAFFNKTKPLLCKNFSKKPKPKKEKHKKKQSGNYDGVTI